MEREKKPVPAAPSAGHDPIAMQVRALDRPERERLEREFREAGAAMGDGMEEFPLKDGGGNSLPGEDASKPKGLNWWEKTVLFILQMFTGVTEEDFTKKRAMSRLASRVRSSRPLLYDVRTNQILPSFAEIVYRLYLVMNTLRQVFEAAQHTSPDGGGRGFIEFFVRRIEPDLPDLGSRYTYEYIKANPQLFEKGHAKATVERDVEQMIGMLSYEKRSILNEVYANFIAFQRLAFFNYFAFLRRFGDISSAREGMPTFRPVDANEALFDLIRLEEAIFGLDLVLNMKDAFSALTAYAESLASESMEEGAQGAQGAPPAQGAQGAWSAGVDPRFFAALAALTKDERFTNIIRMASRTPNRVPVVRRVPVNPLEEMRTALRTRLSNLAEVMYHQVYIDELNKRVSELFGDTEVADIEFYNESTNKKLQSLDLPIFLYCRQLQVVKAFQQRMFEPLVKPALNSIVVDGEFLDKGLHNSLGDYFYKFDDLYHEVRDFERKVSSSFSDGEKLQNMIMRFSGDPPSFKVVSDKIHFLNNLAAKALRSLGELVVAALPALSAVIRDVTGGRKPEFVRNIHQIGGNRNKIVVKAAQRVLEVTTSLAGILETFVKGER